MGFVIALAILAGLAFYSYRNTRNLISSSQWVAHTHAVLFKSEQVLAVAENIALGQSGYTLTGKKEFLEIYNKNRNEVKTRLSNLFEATKDNNAQQSRLKKIEDEISKLLAFSASAVEAREKSFAGAQDLNASLQGKKILDSIRERISEFQQEENVLLQNRMKETEEQIRKYNTSFEGLLLVTGLVLITLFYAINANLKARIETENDLKRVSSDIQDLYENAPCGYHSIDANKNFVDINSTLLRWLGYQQKEEVLGRLKFSDIVSEDSLENFNTIFSNYLKQGYAHDVEFNLKRRDGSVFPVVLSSLAIFDDKGNFVKSRTSTFDNTARKLAETKIKSLNDELEAFTYSVSHDLRAPLRSIDGYARILQEDYNEKIDNEGRRVINVIISNAKRMGQLIDDLLDFSRVGRKEISRANIDMTAFVKSIVNELIEQEQREEVEVIIHPLITSCVDVDMIRQVWLNLISNALKYTGKTKNARIEIKSWEENEAVCYSISDNGVGFEMQYVDKLFGVFQRLHRMQDFSGTGVGLAIVKRIISRHQGDVWAEGKLNEGATFYFRIPQHEGQQ